MKETSFSRPVEHGPSEVAMVCKCGQWLGHPEDVKDVKPGSQVGCEQDDGTLILHPETVYCKACVPADARLNAFLSELTALTKRYGLVIGGCGDCGSPYIDDMATNDTMLDHLTFAKATGAYGPNDRVDYNGNLHPTAEQAEEAKERDGFKG